MRGILLLQNFLFARVFDAKIKLSNLVPKAEFDI